MNRLKLCKPYLVGIATMVSWCCQPVHASPRIAVMLSACIQVFGTLLCLSIPAATFAQQSSPPASAEQSAATPVMTLERVVTADDFDAVPRVYVDALVKVVDAADGQPIEGAWFLTSDAKTFASTDRDGLLLLKNANFVGIRNFIGLRLERIENKRPPMELRKNGVLMNLDRLVLPNIGRSAAITLPLSAPVDLEFRLDFQGKLVCGTVQFAPEFYTVFERPQIVKKEQMRVFIDGGVGFDGYEIDMSSGKICVGPMPKTAKDAYLEIGMTFSPFQLDDDFTVIAQPVASPHRATLVSALYNQARIQISRASLNGHGFREKVHGVTAIRLSDTLVVAGYHNASDNLGGARRDGVSKDVPLPPGTFALLPRSFNGGPYHWMFIRAIRAGVDVAALGVPVFTVNDENPTATATFDGTQTMELYNRVKKALDDKLAADAAANPAPTPEDATDEPPTAPAP